MQMALEELGLDAYHMSSAFKSDNHFNLWNETIDVKYNDKGAFTAGQNSTNSCKDAML